MIAKIINGKSFYGAANYNQAKVDKRQASILYSQNLRTTSPNQIDKTFNLANRTKIKNPVFHVALSFAQADKAKLNDEKMLKITQEYLKKMGYHQQPYLVYRHFDTAHPHVHILTSRVEVTTQRKLPHAFEHRKSKRITDELEVKHDLTISDVRKQTKKEMVADLQLSMKTKPENLTSFNQALKEAGVSVRARSTGRGIVYYKVEDGSEKRSSRSVKSSLFKDMGLDKKSLDKVFSEHQNDRLYVKKAVANTLANTPKMDAATFTKELAKNDIETQLQFNGDKVASIQYRYKNHTYDGVKLDSSLSFDQTKEQLVFKDTQGLSLKQNLMNNLRAGQAIEMEFKDNLVVFTSNNPALNRQLQELPQKEAIDLTRQLNHYQDQYEKADLGGQKIIRAMAEDNLDEYLQRRYQYRQQEFERKIRR